MIAMAISSHPATSSEIHQLLRDEHEQLEVLFREVVEAFAMGERAEAAKLWDRFDHGLEAHLAIEEAVIFPPFAQTHPEEVAALLREHAELRGQLFALGIGVDLHLTRMTAVLEFIWTLGAHAKREDELLYGWAQQNLSAVAKELIHTRISRRPRRRHPLTAR